MFVAGCLKNVFCGSANICIHASERPGSLKYDTYSSSSQSTRLYCDDSCSTNVCRLFSNPGWLAMYKQNFSRFEICGTRMGLKILSSE